MLRKVVSGGQTGVDMAALDAARQAGIITGGWAPRGWLTERGPAPWLAEFGLEECPVGDSHAERYRARTEWNVRDSDATLWIGGRESRGFRATDRAAERLDKMFIACLWPPEPGIPSMAAGVAAVLSDAGIEVLNVAGHRESTHPGIGSWAYEFLCDVFARCGAGAAREIPEKQAFGES